jgi:hypothetical protein
MTTTRTFIVRAHGPRADKADQFTGPHALPLVDWTIGDRRYALAKLARWEALYHHVAMQELTGPTTYGAR